MVDAALVVLTLAGLAAGPPSGRLIPQDTTPPRPPAATTPEGIYRREVFVYPTDNRRDPFHTLTAAEQGPIFENLDLTGIIFGGSIGSIAALIDRSTEKRYRVRRGDVVGNARVIEIRPDAVVFQVTQFGVTRSETLRIKREREEQG